MIGGRERWFGKCSGGIDYIGNIGDGSRPAQPLGGYPENQNFFPDLAQLA
jgi:hypothetical protein